MTPLMKIVMLFAEPDWQKKTVAVKCRKCHFEDPFDAGLPEIAAAKKTLVAL